MDPAPLSRRLSAVLGEDVTVESLRRLTGGASRETWSFTAGARTLVLRRDPPGEDRPERMAREAAAIAAASQAGVPVPRLVDHDTDPAVLGAPYLITEHVDGETIARRILRAPPPGLVGELGRALARIHTIAPAAVPYLPASDPLEDLRATCDGLGEPLPTVEIALRWLERHRPAPVAETLVHGDYRLGNLIVDGDGLAAVLDWELVGRGDPRADLGWLTVKCWRFGSPLPAAGLGTVEELLDGYAEVAGWRPDEEAVRWWRVHGTAWWGLGCRTMAERHLSGETPSVELAAVGRRVCEQEHDLLLELGVPASPVPASGPSSDGGRSSDLHGRPTAAELVAAVAGYLRSDDAGDGSRRAFLDRVAANVLDTVAREMALGPDQERRHVERLANLGCADQAALAAAIRHGEIDADDPALLALVREAVSDRLAVANPRYPTLPG